MVDLVSFAIPFLQALMEKLFYCLSSATIQSTGKRAEVFWDVQRLENGSDFQDDFMNAMQRFIVGCLALFTALLCRWLACPVHLPHGTHNTLAFMFIFLPAIHFACLSFGGLALLWFCLL